MTIKDRITKARELRDKATQGEWLREYKYFKTEKSNYHRILSGEVFFPIAIMKSNDLLQKDLDNFEFIAYAANNILSLADALEKCLEFIKRNEYIHDSASRDFCSACKFLKDLEPSEELTKERGE